MTHASDMHREESVAYNALAILLEGDYSGLRKVKKKYTTWQRAWETEKNPQINPQAEWKKLADCGIRLILQEDEGYPPLLKEIPHPPHALYIKGSFSEWNVPGVAIVGTRRATPQGKECARVFGVNLTAEGLVIVSGLAFGIDAGAHTGALEAGGKTVAVLAGGLHEIYPKSNTKLGQRIIAEGGALISEYPLNAPPFPSRFLERNRIVSGLSRAVIVIEAPERSGSVATARFALEQNRDVFVVPGPATHSNFRGSHTLIREGATLVTTPQEFLEDMGLKIPETERALPLLQPDEERIRAALVSAARPATVDEIIEMTMLHPRIVNQLLCEMTLRNIVREEGIGYTI